MKRVTLMATSTYGALVALLGPLADDRIKRTVHTIPRSSRSERTKMYGPAPPEYMSRRARRRARGRGKAER